MADDLDFFIRFRFPDKKLLAVLVKLQQEYTLQIQYCILTIISPVCFTSSSLAIVVTKAVPFYKCICSILISEVVDSPYRESSTKMSY
jgi:hypothetical protein